MKNLAYVILGSSLLAPMAAMAGGPVTPVEEPVVAAPVIVQARPDGNWTGGYGGLTLGYADIGSSGDFENGSGMIGGILGGYRYDFGQAVVGGEIDWQKADIDLANNTGSLDSLGHVKLQLGYDLGRTLVYGTAGWAYADASSGSDWGYFGGVGADYAVNDRWVVGGEVLQHRFDDFNGSGQGFDTTTVSARVSYRF
ncbi:MAG: hypothetical protein DI533_01960 [Cereibacter sphaeroides]|uniref:Outer membrane protein beta-barrel domain-containing protein n=1 Tax=Cereibacter sphaeroides TaxID=1063 RepID=A0A2W5SF10_CERSP|nr:MAG: hypothetical protein DI533_01960 [Cereibacter sphaeroides]